MKLLRRLINHKIAGEYSSFIKNSGNFIKYDLKKFQSFVRNRQEGNYVFSMYLHILNAFCLHLTC
jgi:hypothetical protein